MHRNPFGSYVESTTQGETVRAFVPPVLPPEPSLAFTAGSQTALDRAMLSLGRLDGAAATMPDVDLLLYTFVRKEAVLSSQIEGIQSTLDELLAHEIEAVPGAPGDDVREVSRYVPGHESWPGTQYLHAPANPVVKAALAHVQFETIHPFLDGNGRVGRLLIALMLCHEKVMRKPLLYPSLYFKEHRPQYHDELNALRTTGDFERWIDFFAEAIRHSAEVAIETARRVTQAFREDRAQLRTVPRTAGSLLMLQEALQAKPVATVATLREATHLTTPTINSLLRELEKRGIIKESTGRARDRVYVYRRYLEALASEEEAPGGASETALSPITDQ